MVLVCPQIHKLKLCTSWVYYAHCVAAVTSLYLCVPPIPFPGKFACVCWTLSFTMLTPYATLFLCSISGGTSSGGGVEAYKMSHTIIVMMGISYTTHLFLYQVPHISLTSTLKLWQQVICWSEELSHLLNQFVRHDLSTYPQVSLALC